MLSSLFGVLGEHKVTDPAVQGSAGLCRAQGSAGCRGLQGTGVCRTQEFARHRGLQDIEVCRVSVSPNRARPQGCALGFWHQRTGSVCLLPGSSGVFGWSQGCGHTQHCLLLPWVPGTGAAVQGFPMSFGHGLGQPVLLSPVSIRFQLKPNEFSSLSCAAV